MSDLVGRVWTNSLALMTCLAIGLAGCGSSGGSSGDGGTGGRDAGPDPRCVAAAMDPMSCFAPEGTVLSLCQSTLDVAASSGCTSEAQAWLDCALPGPADAGVCPTCMDETDAYNACTIGR